MTTVTSHRSFGAVQKFGRSFGAVQSGAANREFLRRYEHMPAPNTLLRLCVLATASLFGALSNILRS